jgi:dolichol-phosphate mannosyltransferase
MGEKPVIELSIVIPSYREEENLRVLLPRLNKVMNENAITGEILVVDTVQPLDNTELVCREFGAKYISRRPTNVYGDAIRTAIQNTNGEYTLFMDADGSHTPEFITRLWSHRKSHHVVVGSRYVEGGDTENPSHLIWMSRLVNLAYGVVLGLRCKDVSNSFKLYQSSQLKALTLKCSNFDIIEETLPGGLKPKNEMNIEDRLKAGFACHELKRLAGNEVKC